VASRHVASEHATTTTKAKPAKKDRPAVADQGKAGEPSEERRVWWVGKTEHMYINFSCRRYENTPCCLSVVDDGKK
jgi:hypothetical protein